MYLPFSREYTIMDSEQYQSKTELPRKDIDEAEIEQIACGSYFGDIHDILIGEIKEEATEFKPISEYGVSNECPKNNENEEFYDSNLDSSKFEVMLRNSIEGPTDSKISTAHFWENGNFNGLADELAKQKVNHFNNGVILKNEGHSESNNDLLTNNVESKTMTLKNEDDIDIIYEDVKPEICVEKAIVKSEYGPKSNSVADMLSGTEIRPNFSHELYIDSEKLPQQNMKEKETAVERDNDTRKESTVTVDSKNCRMIQNLPHPSESKQDINEIPDTEKKPFQCLSCSKSFTRKQNLLHHERVHTGKNLFECQTCSKMLTTKYALLEHQRIHTGEKPFQCKLCSKTYRVKKGLLIHERTHTRKKSFKCKFCSESFTVKNLLLLHIGSHKGKRPFQCKICQKKFAQQSTLLDHERIHTGEKPFQCKICLENFAQKPTLWYHERTHTKPFQCKICRQKFASNSTLLDHERIHTGKKPYECKTCSMSFNRKNDFLNHEIIHTGEKQFQCKICPKSFTLEPDLMKHERIHAGERLFQCKMCPKKFVIKSKLWYEKNHTWEKSFQWKACQKSLFQKGGPTKH